MAYSKGIEWGSEPQSSKHDPRDLSKNAITLSRRAFPRIFQSIKGVVKRVFGELGTPLLYTHITFADVEYAVPKHLSGKYQLFCIASLLNVPL